MSALLAGIFGPSNDTADVMFIFGWILLWIVGVVTLLTAREANWQHGVAWIGLGFIPLGFLFITP